MLIINRHVYSSYYIGLSYNVTLFEDYGKKKYNFKFSELYICIKEIDYLITNSAKFKFTLLNYKNELLQNDNGELKEYWNKRIEFCKDDLYLIETGSRLF